MRILILGNYPPPYGGVPHHIKLLSNFLSENDNSVFVVAGGNGRLNKINNIEIHKSNFFIKFYFFIKSIFKPLFINVLLKNGLSIDNVKYFIRLNIFYLISKKIIKYQKIDIILSYNLYYYSPVAYELYKRFQIPYIVNIFGEIYRLKQLKNNESYYLNILSSSKENISCSRHCAKSIELLKSQHEISYKSILYGIDLKVFKFNNTKKNKIGFFGRIDTEMGVDIFEQIIIKMSNYDLNYIIAGQKGNYHQEIEHFKKNSKFKIETFYNVKTEQLANLYNECKIVIVPTRGLRTCSSLATMEAMACGCVVLGHNLGGIPELINNETGILVDFENIESFVNQINYLLENEEKLNSFRVKSIDYARENFSEEIMCKNFYNIISE